MIFAFVSTEKAAGSKRFRPSNKSIARALPSRTRFFS